MILKHSTNPRNANEKNNSLYHISNKKIIKTPVDVNVEKEAF